MSKADSARETATKGSGRDNEEPANALVRAWNRLRADIDTEAISEVVNVENGRPKIEPKKAKKLAEEQNWYTIKGATGGAMAGALISTSGVLAIPGAAACAALCYAIKRNQVDRTEELEEDFQKVLVAVEEEEEVDLSRLAMIRSIKKETLADDYLPFLEKEGFVKFDEENNIVRLNKSLHQQITSYL